MGTVYVSICPNMKRGGGTIEKNIDTQKVKAANWLVLDAGQGIGLVLYCIIAIQYAYVYIRRLFQPYKQLKSVYLSRLK